MKKKYALFIIALFSIIYSCTKDYNTVEDAEKNSEIKLYERLSSNKKTNSLTPSNVIDLDQNLQKVVQIKYENDILYDLRHNEKWSQLMATDGFKIDKEHIKKSIIDKTSIQLFSIPFTKTVVSGFVNVYKSKNSIFWTFISVENTANNSKKYTITSSNGDPIMQLTLDKDERIYNFSSHNNSNLINDYSLFKRSNSETVTTADDDSINPEPIGGGTDCFKGRSYYQCLQCIIIEHCGSDLACALACGAFPEVCLGIAVLACLP